MKNLCPYIRSRSTYFLLMPSLTKCGASVAGGPARRQMQFVVHTRNCSFKSWLDRHNLHLLDTVNIEPRVGSHLGLQTCIVDLSTRKLLPIQSYLRFYVNTCRGLGNDWAIVLKYFIYTLHHLIWKFVFHRYLTYLPNSRWDISSKYLFQTWRQTMFERRTFELRNCFNVLVFGNPL